MSPVVDRVNLWLDCDCGHDDAMAMYLAKHAVVRWRARDGGVERETRTNVVAMSSTYGNQTIEKTTMNAFRVMKWIDCANDVPLYRGASKPIARPRRVCAEIHGESGMDHGDGTRALPSASEEEVEAKIGNAKPLVEAMYDAWLSLYESGERLVIVATGPLTNVARFVLAYEDVIEDHRRRAREGGEGRGEDDVGPKIVIMGGAIGRGNTGSHAEFNIQCDPEAAQIVFDSSFEVVMVPLEVTHTALATKRVIDSLEEAAMKSRTDGRQRANQINDLLNFFRTTYSRVFGFEDPPLHDPCAVFCALMDFVNERTDAFKDCFVGERERVDVECKSDLTYGQTVIDFWRTSGKPNNVFVVKRMNTDHFWRAMADAIENHVLTKRA